MQKRASILKMPKKAFKKMLWANLALCAAIVILTLTVNIFLTVLRTEETHNTFLIINIISDTAMVWFVYTYAETVLLPRYRTYALFKKAERTGERVSGIFAEFGSKQRYEKKDCVTARISCGSESRKVFILENTFENLFRSGLKITLITADNIAVLYEAIVSEGYMLDDIGDSYFHPIDEKKYEEEFGKVKFYRENGTPYGIVLYDGKSNNKFSNYCHTENKCLLFLTYNSVNAGNLNENTDKGSNFAVLTVEWLLSENGG